jgi:hypothetical protein
MQKSEFGVNAEVRMQNAECRMQNAEGPECSMMFPNVPFLRLNVP